MLTHTNLTMAGYSMDKVPAMQRRMIDALETIPNVEQAGLVNDYPPLVYTSGTRTNIFKDSVEDRRQSNVTAMPYRYNISPGYFGAAGTTLLAGRSSSGMTIRMRLPLR